MAKTLDAMTMMGLKKSATITSTEFRARLGEYCLSVERAHQSFTIMRKGKAVARLVPFDDVTTVLPDGSFLGEPPFTFRRPELLGRRRRATLDDLERVLTHPHEFIPATDLAAGVSPRN